MHKLKVTTLITFENSRHVQVLYGEFLRLKFGKDYTSDVELDVECLESDKDFIDYLMDSLAEVNPPLDVKFKVEHTYTPQEMVSLYRSCGREKAFASMMKKRGKTYAIIQEGRYLPLYINDSEVAEALKSHSPAVAVPISDLIE